MRPRPGMEPKCSDHLPPLAELLLFQQSRRRNHFADSCDASILPIVRDVCSQRQNPARSYSHTRAGRVADLLRRRPGLKEAINGKRGWRGQLMEWVDLQLQCPDG